MNQAGEVPMEAAWLEQACDQCLEVAHWPLHFFKNVQIIIEV